MLNNEKAKIILITSLSALIIILFYFYVSSDDDSTNQTQNSELRVVPLSKDKIAHDIDSILFSFGISKEWIKEITFKGKDVKNSNEQFLISKEVKIPIDLLTIDLNYEITDYLRSNNFRNKVTEDPKTKNIVINIISAADSAGKEAGILKFNYDDSVKRKTADICLVLDSIDEYSLSDLESMLNSTQEYSVILPLRNDKADYQSKIIELKKDYLMKFSVGTEDDIDADFKIDMKESTLKSRIRSLSINFPDVTGIILTGNSGNQEFYKTVKEEFIKNNLMVYSDSMFSSYRDGDSKVTNLFEDIISETKNGKNFLFYDVNFNPDEFDAFDKAVYSLKKSGYRFFNFKELMNLIGKNK